MTAEEKYELFEDYLNNELNDAQRADFEQNLKEDASLQAEFELYAETKVSLTSRIKWEASQRPFIQTIEGLSKQHFKSQKEANVVSISRRRWMLGAVAAAAIAVLIVFVWQPWQEDLYARFAQHPRAELTMRDASSALADAGRAFNQGEYPVALDVFTRYLAEHPDDLEVLFYQGICYLELGSDEEAIKNFRQLFSGNQPYKDTGAWYLGLTFLRQDSPDSTTWYLNQIHESSEYFGKAQILLKKL